MSITEAIDAYERGEYLRCRDLCRLALTEGLSQEDQALASTYLGHSLTRLGDRRGAVVQFRRALALESQPDRRIYLHYELGVGLREVGERREARAEFLQGVEGSGQMASPDSRVLVARSLLGLAILAYEDGDYRTALSWVEQASRVPVLAEPVNEQIRLDVECWRGLALFRLDRWEESIPVLKGVLAGIKPPDSNKALLEAYLGLALSATAQYEEALQILRKTRLDPEGQPGVWAATRVWLGNLYYRRNEFTKALEQFEGIVDRPAEDWVGSRESLARMADCYVETGQFDRALAVAERAFQELRGNALVHIEYAKVLAVVGRASEAEQVLRELPEETVEPDLRERYFAHSVYTAARRGDRNATGQWLYKLRTHNPTSRYLRGLEEFLERW
jgi:tetratricopeptide (TPR) repeat protein